MKRLAAVLAPAASLLLFGNIAHAAVHCDADNGGIKLPTGFCAQVAAEGLKGGRHAAIAPNGDMYVSLLSAGGRRAAAQPGGVVALRDADGDGVYETKEVVTTGSATGVALHNGYLYVTHQMSVERFKMTPGTLKPTGPSELIVTDLPKEDEHHDKGIAFDGKGGLYINVGAPSNACQSQDRVKGVPGQTPCPILEKHGGIWRFDENKLNQTQDNGGVRYATGMRQEPAITWFDGSLFVAMNSRDQLDTLWPEHFNAEDNATRPAEPLYKVAKGDNFGWPFCFYDLKNNKDIRNPEYGGDGTDAGDCAKYNQPVAVYPAHWAPVDIMFYTGRAYPAKYRDGAFIAFHGSWNRSPLPQEGYNITFQPFNHGKPSGKYEVFASGFAGSAPIAASGDATYRPDGVAQAPDGTLFIVDSEKGRVWHVLYNGGAGTPSKQAAAASGVGSHGR